MKTVLVALLAAAAAALPQRSQTFTGVITDDMCPLGSHAHMRMGPTDAECTRACVDAHGASYALSDGKNVYVLSDQKTPERFAGERVRVTGRLDEKTKKIEVESIATAR